MRRKPLINRCVYALRGLAEMVPGNPPGFRGFENHKRQNYNTSLAELPSIEFNKKNFFSVQVNRILVLIKYYL